jgi:glycosyltransferase involved in cell wall biosynthesis
MSEPPSILMVTWNRREYFERTLANLLQDSSDFRLHMWDNGSVDGVADLIADLRDERIVAKKLNPSNAGQPEPWHWFMEAASGEVAGKLDDDILAPAGWMTRFSDMLLDEPRLGTLGAWVFLESEWDEEAASHKIVTVGRHRIFRSHGVPGGIFLGRLQNLKRYTKRDPSILGIPLAQAAMSRDGFVNGYPLPLVFAEHLDDPRSPHCRMNRPGGWDQFAAYTARMRGFTGPEEYGRWIAADARYVLETPFKQQLRAMDPPWQDRLWAKVRRRLSLGRSK